MKKTLIASLALLLSLSAHAQSKGDSAETSRQNSDGIAYDFPVAQNPIRFQIVEIKVIHGDGDFQMIGTDGKVRIQVTFGSSAHKTASIVYFNSKGEQVNAYNKTFSDAAVNLLRSIRGVNRQCPLTVTVSRPELEIKRISASCDQLSQTVEQIADDAG